MMEQRATQAELEAHQRVISYVHHEVKNVSVYYTARCLFSRFTYHCFSHSL